jgi:Flp pilus assembly protein TadD
VAYARRAVDLMPNQPAMIDTLAMAMAAERQLDGALTLQKQAVELAPDDNGLRLNLARIALQAGDKALARKELERLQALGPTLPYRSEVATLIKAL